MACMVMVFPATTSASLRWLLRIKCSSRVETVPQMLCAPLTGYYTLQKSWTIQTTAKPFKIRCLAIGGSRAVHHELFSSWESYQRLRSSNWNGVVFRDHFSKRSAGTACPACVGVQMILEWSWTWTWHFCPESHQSILLTHGQTLQQSVKVNLQSAPWYAQYSLCGTIWTRWQLFNHL